MVSKRLPDDFGAVGSRVIAQEADVPAVIIADDNLPPVPFVHRVTKGLPDRLTAAGREPDDGTGTKHAVQLPANDRRQGIESVGLVAKGPVVIEDDPAEGGGIKLSHEVAIPGEPPVK